MKRVRVWVASALICATGCSDDKSDSKANTARPDSGAPTNAGGKDGDVDDPVLDASTGSAPGLDAKASAEDTAESVCALAPWVLASITAKQLPKDKITNTLREDSATFFSDKPPICLNDKDAGEDLCDEMPTGTTTYTFLYRGEAATATDPVQQVWCKSDNFEDIARIAGVGATKKGSCETLHDIVVAWATAQLKSASKRSIRYEANPLERGSQWTQALVATTEEGDVLVANCPELFADTKEAYIANTGTAPPAFLTANFFGNHYCKLISPGAALAWLSGT